MKSQSALQSGSMKTLDEIFESPNNLANEVRDWAIDRIGQGKDDILANTNNVLTTKIFYSMCSGLGKLKGVYAADVIDLMTKVYGPDGPLETQEFSILPKVANSPELIGALYFLANSDFKGISVKTRKRAIKIVAEIAFEAKNKWEGVNAVLQKIDQTMPGHGLVDSIPDRLGSFHNHMGYAIDVVSLQEAGGVKRLKEVGADLKKVCEAGLSQMGKASLWPVSWPPAYVFFKEALEELKISGRATQSDVNAAFGSILGGFLNSLERKRFDNYEELKPIFTELMPFASTETASSLAINLFRCNGLEWLGAHREQVVSMIDAKTFKDGLVLVDKDNRHSLVRQLGLEHLFTSSELNTFKGARLESALGL
jgi:hypothetical protein